MTNLDCLGATHFVPLAIPTLGNVGVEEKQKVKRITIV